MNVIPIQVTDEGVLIPKTYLREASEVEVIITEDYVLVRPKRPVVARESGARPPRKSRRYTFIGSGRTRNPQASAEAEQILEREADRRSGWSHVK